MTGKTVKIFNEKLNFRDNASSKVGSMENFNYQPKNSEFQMFNDRLPWLRYNKPNLPETIKNQIDKKEYPGQTENKFDRMKQREYDLLVHQKVVNNSSPKLIQSKINSLADSQDDLIKNKPDLTEREINKPSANKTIKKDHSHKDLKSVNDKNHLKTKSILHKKESIDVTTETDKIRHRSVESQASFGEISKAKLIVNLKRAMVNSITIPEKLSDDVIPKSYSKQYETKTSHLNRSSDKRKTKGSQQITNDFIDILLPSIPQSSKENNSKQYSTYTFPNNYPDTFRNRLPDPEPALTDSNKLSVTHAGIDFLDHYWANQRMHMINKENFHFHNEIDFPDREYKSAEKETSRLPQIETPSESHSFQEMYQKRLGYYSLRFNANNNHNNKRYGFVDKITPRDLERLVL